MGKSCRNNKQAIMHENKQTVLIWLPRYIAVVYEFVVGRGTLKIILCVSEISRQQVYSLICEYVSTMKERKVVFLAHKQAKKNKLNRSIKFNMRFVIRTRHINHCLQIELDTT